MRNSLFGLPSFRVPSVVFLSLASQVLSAADFTAELTTPPATTMLVAPANNWRVFKGTAAPAPDWLTTDEVFLGSSWSTLPGGFGFGYPGITTTLTDMQNRYSTLYLRQTFMINSVIAPDRLKLRVDYDDGFVAWLNGREIARANVPGSPGETLAHNAVAPATHPAAVVTGTAVDVFSMGPQVRPLFVREEDGPRLKHILALQGVNRSIGDGTFLVQPTLVVEDLFAMTTTASVGVRGVAAMAGLAKLTVNGAAVNVDPATKRWSQTTSLRPGMNRIVTRALDSGNRVLAAITNDIVSKPSAAVFTGTLAQNTTWSPSMGVIEVAGRIEVPSGVTLTIAAGTTVLLGPSASIQVHGILNAEGTAAAPIFLLPADPRTVWKEIALSGTGSAVSLKFTEMAGAGIRATDYAKLLIEDSIVRDFSFDADRFERYLVYGLGYCQLTLRRSQFLRYYTMAFGGQCVLQAEDCVFDGAEHDFIKPQETPAGSYIRRCLFKRGGVFGTDGIDTAVNAQLLVESSVFHDIPDKAISIEGSKVTVTNCLIYDVGMGLAVKDDSRVFFFNSTVANSQYGLASYLKNPGANYAEVFATNVIVWGNITNVTVRNPDTGATAPTAIARIGFSDIAGSTVYAGTANMNRDPLFVDPVNGNFTLQSRSPAIGTGFGGQNLGVTYPVGPATIAEIPVEVPVTISYSRTPDQLVLQLIGNPGTKLILESSAAFGNWTVALSNSAPAGVLEFRDNLTVPQRFYRLRQVK